MGTPLSLKDIDVVILCGGLGKRLQGVVADRPKPMAEINQRPFLDILIEYVAGYGFNRFILCIGYMGEVIRGHYQKSRRPSTILFSEEKEPLGTAGAIKNAEPLIQSSPFLVMNGDSFCQVELDRFIDFHITKGTLVTMVLAWAGETADYGSVTINSSGQILRFDEKVYRGGRRLINAGVYLMEEEVLSLIPPHRNYSLEYHLFPMIIDRKVYGYVTEGGLIDIGTPQRYAKARDFIYEKGGLSAYSTDAFWNNGDHPEIQGLGQRDT
ncbi:MAG: nucleotidyltransferase family protein [bacterium]